MKKPSDKARSATAKPKKWKPGLLTYAIALLALLGTSAGLYPMAAGWIASFNQSKVIVDSYASVKSASPSPEAQIQQAHEYNRALTSGVTLEKGGNIPIGSGNLANSEFSYPDLLQGDGAGLMARITIPSIGVDLPIYHGTSDATLLRGAGHLEGSHLPVGGVGNRSVITAHRGLANAVMFTNLDDVAVKDTFTIEVMGKALVYQVREIEVIDPDDTGSLTAKPGEDLVTLVTCTPLGINTQRILVTGERISPTPEDATQNVGARPNIPGFPWWIVWGGGSLVVTVAYVVHRGFLDARVPAKSVSSTPRSSRRNVPGTNPR